MSECQCPDMEAMELLLGRARDLDAVANAAAQEIADLPYLLLEEDDRRRMRRLQSLVPATADAAARLVDDMERIIDKDAIPNTPLNS